MSKHSDFILKPQSSILQDAINVFALIDNGMTSYPAKEYFMQSTFLKMTGAQEQKFKCVVWELATVDYTYRYELFREGLGECSAYKDKNSIFIKLTDYINQKQVYTINNYYDIINNATNIINKFCFKFGQYLGNSIKYYDEVVAKTNSFINDPKELFKANEHLSGNIGIVSKNKNDDGNNIYGLLWKHRNRCAHNLQSYQDNSPSFAELDKPLYKFYNYLVFFYLLLLIDYKLIEYYKKFIEITKQVF